MYEANENKPPPVSTGTGARIVGWKMPFPGRVIVTCPECNETGGLDHDVSVQGFVTPSLVCPNDACSFHDWVALQNWNHGELKRKT